VPRPGTAAVHAVETGSGGSASEPDRGHRSEPYASVTVGDAFRALLFVALYLAVFAGLVIGLHASHLVEQTRSSAPFVLLIGLSLSPVLALYVHLMRRRRLSWSDLGFARPRWRLLHLFWQVPLGVGCALAVQALVLTLVFGSEARERTPGGIPDELLSGSAPLALVALLALALVAPLWEEVLFRGAFFAGFLRRFGPYPAVLLSALVFAAVHGSPLVMPYVLVLGLFLGWLRWFHRSLWASLVLHMTNNALVAVVVSSGL
jgi:membrane protease YdiL (CAAX protease family)